MTPQVSILTTLVPPPAWYLYHGVEGVNGIDAGPDGGLTGSGNSPSSGSGGVLSISPCAVNLGTTWLAPSTMVVGGELVIHPRLYPKWGNTLQ